MKKQIFLVLACLVGAVQAFASGCDPDCCNDCLDFNSKLTVDLGGGLRWDNISFKRHNGFGSTHDKLNDIKIGQIQGDIQYLACEHLLLKGYFDYGWVYGKTRHSVRVNEEGPYGPYSDFSSSGFSTHSKKGNAYDLYGAVGYQFNWDCYQVAFAPLVGYSYNYLKLNRGSSNDGSSWSSGSGSELSGSESIGSESSSFSSSSGCNGRGTKFRLSGPWVGFAATYQWSCDLQLFVDYAFHWARFHATANETNFFGSERSRSLKSKNAYGNEVVVGATYTLCDSWFAGLNFNYRNWYGSKSGHNGSSNVYGSFSSESDSKLRNFNWNTYVVSLDIGYSF